MRTSHRLAFALAGATALWAAGCGDNSALCGEGTTNVKGYCVADGTATCGQGTIMDSNGDCVIDPNACAAGTVYDNGECVPEGTNVHADYEEGPEPNDGTVAGDGHAGAFNLPAAGASGVVIHGCVDPYRDLDNSGNPDIDYDMWDVTTTGPALVDIVADGVQGLDAGYFVIPGTALPDLNNAGFQRFGINLSGDTSQRQIYLPEAGTYELVMTDSRSMFLQDGAAGSASACYYTTIKQVAIPTPTAVTANVQQDGEIKDKPLFYSYTPQEGGLADAIHSIDQIDASPSMVVMKNSAFAGYGVPSFFGPAEVFSGGLAASDSILYVADPVYNYALAPVTSHFMLSSPTTFALPTDGSTVTETNVSGSFNTIEDLLFGYVDISADKVVHFHFDFSAPSEIVFTPVDLTQPIIADITGLLSGFGTPVSTYDGWVRFPAAGRYYVVFLQDGATAGSTIDITSKVDQITPTPLAIGTPVTNAPFSALGATWYTLDTSSAIWLAENASATGFGGNVEVDNFDPNASGAVDFNLFASGGHGYPSNGSGTFGDIVYQTGASSLLRVTDTAGTATSAATYGLSVANRNFTDLGTVTQAAAITQTGIATTAGGNLFFVRANPGDEVSITATPTSFNASIDLLNRDESVARNVNTGANGVAETLGQFVDASGFIAFRVNKLSGTGTTFDLSVTASPPSTYTVTNGSLSFVDACATGNAITLNDTGFGNPNDEGISDPFTMPFSFDLHGQTATDYYVSSNGFVSFTPSVANAFFVNAPIPTQGAPDGVVAPLWSDIIVSQLCSLETANSVTIEWVGSTYGSGVPVQFETILNSDDTIDFVYGSGETFDGAVGTVGTESLGGTVGNQVEYNSGGVTAATSKIFTPN